MIPMCHSNGEHKGVGDITLREYAILRSNIIEATDAFAKELGVPIREGDSGSHIPDVLLPGAVS